MTLPGAEGRPDWPEAMATVIRCHYEMRAGRALAFGVPSSRHFHITYNYWAGGELHEGDCFLPRALPVGSLFPIRYNPELPHRSRDAAQTAPSRLPLLLFGIAGSVVLSLAWLLILHGCS